MIAPSFWYLATPYSNYPDRTLAYRDAIHNAALLIDAGWNIFCPIAHSHEIDLLKPQSHDRWLALDAPFISAAKGLIICKLPGWDKSKGILHELDEFKKMKKPVLFMTPGYALELDELLHGG